MKLIVNGFNTYMYEKKVSTSVKPYSNSTFDILAHMRLAFRMSEYEMFSLIRSISTFIFAQSTVSWIVSIIMTNLILLYENPNILIFFENRCFDEMKGIINHHTWDFLPPSNT